MDPRFILEFTKGFAQGFALDFTLGIMLGFTLRLNLRLGLLLCTRILRLPKLVYQLDPILDPRFILGFTDLSKDLL